MRRPQGQSIQLTQGQSIVLTSDQTQQASTRVLPLNWHSSFMGCGLQPGSQVFVGQYLFTGAETTSAYLTVYQVCEWDNRFSLGQYLFTGAETTSAYLTVYQLCELLGQLFTGALFFVH